MAVILCALIVILYIFIYVYLFKTTEACFGQVVNTETRKILHFWNCTSNCSNSSRILELYQTLSNPCFQKIELNNPDNQYVWQGNHQLYGHTQWIYTILANCIFTFAHRTRYVLTKLCPRPIGVSLACCMHFQCLHFRCLKCHGTHPWCFRHARA
jgi:hypothetical protein